MIKTIAATLIAGFMASAAMAGSYTATVTNNMDTELLAPILITDAAEEQILTGNPAALARRIGAHAMAGHRANIAHGTDGPPGVLLAPGKSLSCVINTDADTVRVLAMVAPTEVPDNYVTALVDLKAAMMDENGMHGMAGDSVALSRHDIGNDEGTRTITAVPGAYATITFTENM